VVPPIKPFAFDITDEEIEEFTREAAKILRSGILILGEYTRRFEQAFAEFIGVKHAIAVNNGAGAGFDRYVQELHVGARLKVSHSAMVVAWPALSRLNFARMSIKPKFHFNHMLQRGKGKQGPIRFSMLANSGFWDRDAHVAEKVADIDAILEAAERYIGREPLYTSKLYTYECAKTEFLSEEEEKRRYSYWIEHARDTNYIAVLPGKFSFFPTVAYHTYLRIKELLQLDAAVYHPTYGVDPAAEQQAKALVADPYPIQILSSELDGEVDLLKRVCEEDSVVSATRS
jgi:DegT/DnrJ/EryC1/StrS aminotransferase family